MDTSEDQVRVDRVRNGDPASYSFLVDKYKYMAYTIAVKILGNAEDAQDVAQESFIKAYQQIHQFQGRSKFSTWLYTIVYRTSVSKLKENRIETLSISDEIHENYTGDYTTPQHEQLHLKDQKEIVKQAIQNLPKTEALLITLYYLSENTVKEIQEITGISVANIKIKLFRARKKLEKELKFLLENEPTTVLENAKK
jgi:RNA polymerase sigma factor (sigma-70 family)